ncbi:penicillin-binding protein 2 [Thiomicrorhabdus xiamenensis]|uniref:Peptidoglycan D,D-transpeptidase FtsI n=1 Tax=Thiomicrorhabdus xiamenensis TaxID=2739063 RepID=A0A7D4P495_9GAMM|nr:penicillin-binding protein 2 [Thiomicrorhabdus xiamenensis]
MSSASPKKSSRWSVARSKSRRSILSIRKWIVNRFLNREIVIFFLIVMMMSALVAKAFITQIVKADEYQEKADDRHIRSYNVPGVRGQIYDRNGNLLAMSTPMVAVELDPKQIVKNEANYHEFLQLIELKNNQLLQRARENRDRNLSFIRYIKTPELKEKIEQLALPGVHIKKTEHSYVSEYQGQQRQVSVKKEYHSLWINEKELDRIIYTFDRLAKVLGISASELRKRAYANQKRRHMYVKRSLTPDFRDKVEALRLPHVYVSTEYKRYYPNGESMANLLGYTNVDGKGIEGIELAYNKHLSGRSGKKIVVKDVKGNVINLLKTKKQEQDGNPLVLSIDQNIQYLTYKALKQVMYKHQPKSASAVVLDAKTGEVLAMASLPSFNVNDTAQRRGPGIRNRVVADVLEPGSTMKPFVIAKALDEGVVDLQSKIDTGRGFMRVQGKLIKDTSRHGVLTPEEIIQKSSNVGTAKIAFRMPAEVQYDLFKQLGFKEGTHTYLPGETAGRLKDVSRWSEIDQATTSYGYGLSVNLLTLARAYTVFANQGRMLDAHLFKMGENEVPASTPIFSPQASQKVLDMMNKVVAPGGTAPLAMIPGYQVAGKTGTSHKVSRQGGYEDNTYLSLFAGMVPASDPDMVMVVAVNEPSRGKYYGGLVAAPVFKEVMQNALRLRKVKPDWQELPNLPLPASDPRFAGQIARGGM